MTRRFAAAALALGILGIVSGASTLAHPGHTHKVMGTVTMAAADHLMIEDREGKEVTIKVTKDTKVKSKPPMKAEEIKAGTRVVVTATMGKDQSMTAQTIEVGVAAKPAR